MTALLAAAHQWFAANQFASGGAVLGAAGILIAALRRVPGAIVEAVKRRIIVTAEITSQDEAFSELAAWLARHAYSRRARRWLVITRRDGEPGGDAPILEGEPRAGRRREPDRLFVPAPGHHLFRHAGRWLWVQYGRERMQAERMLIGFHESITLRAFGRSAEPFRAILAEAHEQAMPEAERSIAVYTVTWNHWQRATWQEARPLDSLVFDDDLAGRLVADLRRFRASRDRYRALGVPWRRGYLLHGEPGNGKSSLIAAVAGEFGMDLYVVSITKVMSDDTLRSLLLSVPRDAAVVMEDIDGVGAATMTRDANGDAQVLTRSGLLNALDGIICGEGRIVFMTTNHRDGLDPALLRPGRADVHLYLGNASRTQAAAMFRRFFPEADGFARQFGEAVEPDAVSMAALQGHFLAREGDPERALAEAGELAAGAPS